MLVLVINLDRSADRLAHMRAQFARHGLVFVRLAATDGRELDRSRLAVAPTREGRALSDGEIACFVSHRRCWQMLLDSEESHAVVLEDDVLLGEGAKDFLTGPDWIPAAAGLVKLETYRSATTIRARPCAEAGGRGVHLLMGTHLGTGGYALDRATASLLLELGQTIDQQVDDFLFRTDGEAFARARVHQLVPAICVQGLKQEGKGGQGTPPAFESLLYGERRRKRRPLGVAAKLRREFLSALSKAGAAVAGGLGNLGGRTRWGRIPYR